MTGRRRLSRRAALGSLAAAGAAGLAGSSLILRNARRDSQAVLDNLLAFYRDRGAAASVGARYLGDRPAEKSIETIANLLCPPRSQRFTTLAAAGKKEAREFIASWLVDDFANKRIVDLSGWQLSLAEARLCALAALSKV